MLRRHLLMSGAILPARIAGGFMLASCSPSPAAPVAGGPVTGTPVTAAGGTGENTVAILATDFNDAKLVLAGIEAALANTSLAAVLAPVEAQIQKYVADATTGLGALSGAIGGVVAPTSITNVLADLSGAVSTIQAVVPANPYTGPALIVLAILTASWTAFEGVAPRVQVAPTTLAQARFTLAALPPPAIATPAPKS